MIKYPAYVLTLVSLLIASVSQAADPVFSGPQPGEPLPSFKVKAVFGEDAGKEINGIDQADGKPVVIVFFHELSRPAFGLTALVARYAASRSKDGLSTSWIFVTDDVTKTENFMKRVQKNFPPEILMGISVDGQEGPGAYGLNRNVALTVLVAHKNKVTANFALVQPSVQADGLKIVKAIVDVLGGGKVPSLAELGGGRYARTEPARVDPKLTALLQPILDKEAKPSEVSKATQAVEAYVEKSMMAKRQLAQTAQRLERSGELEKMTSPSGQKQIRTWARVYGRIATAPAQPARRPQITDRQLAVLLRTVLNKEASKAEVSKAATAVETYVADHPATGSQLGAMTRWMAGSGNLANYGTADAQVYIRKWARKFAASPRETPRRQKDSSQRKSRP